MHDGACVRATWVQTALAQLGRARPAPPAGRGAAAGTIVGVMAMGWCPCLARHSTGQALDLDSALRELTHRHDIGGAPGRDVSICEHRPLRGWSRRQRAERVVLNEQQPA